MERSRPRRRRSGAPAHAAVVLVALAVPGSAWAQEPADDGGEPPAAPEPAAEAETAGEDDDGEEDEDDDALDDLDFVRPLQVEGGPLIGAGRATVPSTHVWASVAAAGGTWSVGRAAYTEVFGRVVAGGAWAPFFLPRLEIGGDMAFLVGQSIHTEVPPAIDEWATELDVGELRVHVAYLVWDWTGAGDSLQLAVTPHVRLTIPTDTSRWSPSRWGSPLRRVLGSQIVDHEFVLTDVGATAAFSWSLLTIYETLGFVFGAVVDGDFQYLQTSTTGIGIDTGVGLEAIVELNVLVRATEAPPAGTMAAVAVSPGLRYRIGDWRIGLESRVGLTEGAEAPYGDATVGLTVRWDL